MKFPIIGAIFAGLVAAVGIDHFSAFVALLVGFDDNLAYKFAYLFAGDLIGYAICLKIAPAKIRKTLVVIFAFVLSLSDALQYAADGGLAYATPKETWDAYVFTGLGWIIVWVYGAVLPLITGIVIYFIFYKEKKTMSSKKQK